MNYLLDTNIITALIKGDSRVLAQLQKHRGDGVYLCQPVYYEAMRGLLWKNATTKIAALHRLRARFGWFQLVDSDWDQAGLLWVQAVSKGRQLADIDLLIAAIALRQDAIVVSDDNDFDALPVKRENWRA
ncbi:MAG: PIN domain-containing protein [Anaerolineae bacterium]|nr:PIN domain-containing protein [Anaerolineae bacterium]